MASQQEKEAQLRQLLTIESLEGYTEKKALEILQSLIDYSHELGTIAGTKKALELGRDIKAEEIFAKKLSLFYYFMSVAWSDIRSSKRKSSEAWTWNHYEMEQEIVHLRRAIKAFNPEVIEQPDNRLAQFHPNLGINLSFGGRYIAALANWYKAFERIENFGMALGAFGDCLIYQGMNSLYDEGHRRIYIAVGYSYLKKATSKSLEVNARKDYEMKVKCLEATYPWVKDYSYNTGSFEGRSPEEVNYRKWCSQNTLFLNPLNDINKEIGVGYDPLGLPTMIIHSNIAGSYHSLFNQIKQEFITARLFLFEGLCLSNGHYADKDVMKYDLMDFSENSVSIEKIKASYRLAYSLFDKVSYFLNSYFELQIPDHQIDFRTIWYASRRSSEIRPVFKRKASLLLRALYLLHKDLHYRNTEFELVIEPEARDLAIIRNHLEHKGLRVYHDSNFLDIAPKLLKDNISHPVSYGDFCSKTLKVLRLAREAIIYLSLGIRWEERANESSENHKPPSITMGTQ